MKVICNKEEGEKVVGFHVLGPNAEKSSKVWQLP